MWKARLWCMRFPRKRKIPVFVFRGFFSSVISTALPSRAASGRRVGVWRAACAARLRCRCGFRPSSCTDSLGTHTTYVNSYEIFGTSAYFNGAVYLGVTPTSSSAPAGVRRFTYSGTLSAGSHTSLSIQQNRSEEHTSELQSLRHLVC